MFLYINELSKILGTNIECMVPEPVEGGLCKIQLPKIYRYWGGSYNSTVTYVKATGIVSYFSIGEETFVLKRKNNKNEFLSQVEHIMRLTLVAQGSTLQYTIETKEHSEMAKYILSSNGEILEYTDFKGNIFNNKWAISFPYGSIKEHINNCIYANFGKHEMFR